MISKGEIILVEDKHVLMHKLGKKQLTLHLQRPLTAIPDELAGYPLELTDAGNQLVFTFDAQHEDTGIAELLKRRPPTASTSRTCSRARARWRKSSSTSFTVAEGTTA